MRTKIWGALLLAGFAGLAALLPSFVAVLRVREGAAGRPMGLLEAMTPANVSSPLEDLAALALATLVSGAASVVLFILALGVLASRHITRPLTQVEALLEQEERATGGGIAALPDRLRTRMAELERRAADAGELQNSQHLSEERFRDFATLASDWLWETDDAGRLTYFSGALDDDPGGATNAILGQSLSVLMTPVSNDAETRLVELESRRPLKNLLCEFSVAGEPARFCRLSGRAIVSEGVFRGYRGVATDVTEETRAEAAEAPEPEGLLDRLPDAVAMRETLRQALSARKFTKTEVAVITLDLDQFVDLVDAHGPALGEAIRTGVVERLLETLRQTDALGHGEDGAFVILQNAREVPDDCVHLANRCLEAMARPFDVEGASHDITASLGIAIAAMGATSEVNILRDSAIALSRAKNDGRGRFRFHDASINEALRARFESEKRLRDAIEKRRIALEYQPIYRATDGALLGFEAFPRWSTEANVPVSQKDLVAETDALGLLPALSEHLLRTACRDAMSWPDLAVAINLTEAQILDERLLKTVISGLRESCLHPKLLDLEIPEAALLDHPDKIGFQLDALRDLGVRLTLDQFGSGPASIGCVRAFRFHKVKLSRTLVSRMEQDNYSMEIAQSVSRIGKTLEVEIAADGIQTETQVKTLREIGCMQVQGRLLGQRTSADQVFNLLKKTGTMPGAPRASKQL